MNKHETDVASLAFGSIFLAVVASWLFARFVEINWPSAGWFLASGMVLLGLLGLLTALRPSRHP